MRTLRLQVQRKLKQKLALANSFFNKEFDEPTISYNVRGAKAGVAYLERNEVRFNPVLLQENRAEFIENVVPHELAHILVYQQFGKVQPHGREWKAMMEKVLGVPAETYHRFELDSVRETFEYRCGCQTHSLTIRRHKTVQEKGRSYICRKCGQKLQYSGK